MGNEALHASEAHQLTEAAQEAAVGQHVSVLGMFMDVVFKAIRRKCESGLNELELHTAWHGLRMPGPAEEVQVHIRAKLAALGYTLEKQGVGDSGVGTIQYWVVKW